MKDFLLKIKKLFQPGVVVTILLTVISSLLLAVVFIYGYEESYLGYISYVVSAYTLTAICLYIPTWVKGIKKIIYRNRHANKIATDAIFRAHVSIIFLCIFDTVYAIFKLVSAKVLGSYWHSLEGMYYFILGLSGFFMMTYMIKYSTDRIKCCKVYRRCGYMLILLDVIFLTMAYFIINYNKGIIYPGLMIYATATYTFILMAVSIVNLIKYRKYHIPIISASKVIKLISATVSIFMLQSAMLNEFGSEEENLAFKLNLTTGITVGVLVLAISIYMIINANVNIKN